MRVVPTGIDGLLVVELEAHQDNRGFFLESWREDWGRLLNLPSPFVQDNHARSEEKGVLRGLHFQAPPHAQSKLVWVSSGSVFDVAVDIRKGSPTYGKAYGITLTAQSFRRFFIPRGFAHGYMTLEKGTEFHYKVDAYYAPESEGGLIWSDASLAIEWPDIAPVLSPKDRVLPNFASFDSPFIYGSV